MFKGPFDESIVARARDESLVEINIHNLRDWATNKHKNVDDKPFGGGAGMVLKVGPVFEALCDIKKKDSKAILLSPQGEKYTQVKAKKLAKLNHIILISGHYEGFDERIREHLVDEEVSIGDYVLTGGELPAMVLVDSIVRLLPGALGDKESLIGETHSSLSTTHKTHSTNIKHPVYTRPEDFKGWRVPEVLLSGNHAEIEKWKAKNKKKPS